MTSGLFTIGHSNHEAEYFVSLLTAHKIDCLVDVRSAPYSRYVPHFGKEALAKCLYDSGIRYLFFGKELGARREETDVRDEAGRTDYFKVRRMPLFNEGIARIKDGLAKGYRIAMMCAEANPLDCHRFYMISYQFARDGIDLKHILKDGSAKPHSEFENELLRAFESQINSNPLLEPELTRAETIDRIYALAADGFGNISKAVTK
jgi:uncharacterized protein (DUF488 family)